MDEALVGYGDPTAPHAAWTPLSVARWLVGRHAASRCNTRRARQIDTVRTAMEPSPDQWGVSPWMRTASSARERTLSFRKMAWT